MLRIEKAENGRSSEMLPFTKKAHTLYDETFV